MDLTSIFKIVCDNETKQTIISTMEVYTESFNRVCQIGWPDWIVNGVDLHHKTYREEREKTKLPSQLVITARMKATEALQSARTLQKKNSKLPEKKQKKVSCPYAKKLLPIRYDNCCLTIKLQENKISISTLDGRKNIALIINDHHQNRLNWIVRSSDLCLHENGELYFHIVLRRPFDMTPKKKGVIGIDLGIKRPAVTSDVQFLGNKRWGEIERRYFRLKRSLQAKGTDSAKRHLKRLSKKVNRFRNDCDHVLSKRIVLSNEKGTTFVLEDLTDIRTRVKMRKQQRRQMHAWSFERLKRYLQYKSELYGRYVAFVDPRYTSQKCSKCSHIDPKNRKSQSEFCCKQCNFQLNADLNAARNIRLNYLASVAKCDASGLLSTSLS